MADTLPNKPEQPIVPQEQVSASPESVPETSTQEQKEQHERMPAESSTQGVEQQPSHPIAQPAQSAPEVPKQSLGKSEAEIQVEGVLEEGMQEAFSSMDQQHQHMFKEAGEHTAREIVSVMNAVKVQTQQVFELIKAWLRIIPGVSKWYVIQEAKIKTDKILHMKDNNN